MPSWTFSTVLCQHVCTWHRQNRKGRYKETTKAASQQCYPDSCHIAHISYRCEIWIFTYAIFWGRTLWVRRIANSRLTRKFAVLYLSSGWNFLREILIPTPRKSVCLWHEQKQKPWESIAFLVLGDAGVRTYRQCPMTVNGEYCGLLLKIVKGLQGGSITGKENSTELASNYTRVIDWAQRGRMGMTESPEYLIKSPPTYCLHQSHPEVLRCCRYDHSPNYRATGQAAGERKQPQTFSKWINKRKLFSLFLRLALLWHRYVMHPAFE